MPEAKAYILGQQHLRRNLQTNPAIIDQLNKLSYRKVADFLPLAAGKIEMKRYHVYRDYRLVVDSVTVYRTPVFYEDASVMSYEDFMKKLDDPESEFYKNSVKAFSVQAVLINDYEVEIKKDDAWAAELSDIDKLNQEYGDRLSILVNTRQKDLKLDDFRL